MIEITAEIRALIDKAAAGVELAGDEYIDPADGLIPVSYTHLDVYKRQPPYSASVFYFTLLTV